MPKAKAKKAASDPFDINLDLELDLGFGRDDKATSDPFDINLDLELDLGFGRDDKATTDGIDIGGDFVPDRDAPESDVEYTDGDYEKDAAAEIAAVKKDFSQVDLQRKKASQTIEASRDTDYVIQVVFLDRKQRDAFLKASKWDDHGKRYVNGLELARAMGIQLPESNYRPPKGRTDKTLSAFALDLKEIEL